MNQHENRRMQELVGSKSRIFVTGSASGLGYLAAEIVLKEGHSVVVHVRSKVRASTVQKLVDRGAIVTIGDLASRPEAQTKTPSRPAPAWRA